MILRRRFLSYPHLFVGGAGASADGRPRAIIYEAELMVMGWVRAVAVLLLKDMTSKIIVLAIVVVCFQDELLQICENIMRSEIKGR